MASRFGTSSAAFTELSSVEEVAKKLQENSLVLILFNKKYATEHDIEHKFSSLRSAYEKNHDLHVYKCAITPLKSDLKTTYKVTKAPTFIIFRDGTEISRLEDVDKADSNGGGASKTPEEKLRSWLDSSCTSK